ncbi:hypothetical protein DERF_014211 [Dermatophagoides farinae]|uniref:Uncharacterized protein n=1 Tax=Dermatophagoides farinae TaxID=6954 RepID=A0A922L130_DERFA|nr:hypothetical protein DERF_014211 [Dermatophagoides farinae]
MVDAFNQPTHRHLADTAKEAGTKQMINRPKEFWFFFSKEENSCNARNHRENNSFTITTNSVRCRRKYQTANLIQSFFSETTLINGIKQH